MNTWAKRVVLFGIDGAGTFFEQTPTPNMDRIFKNGAVSRRTLTEIPTISAECWGGMLHGVDCRRHGLTNWLTGHRPFPADSPYPSVFRVIREQRLNAELASFCDWNNVNFGIIEDGLGVYKYHAKDYDLVQPAIDYVNSHDFTMMYFQFDSVDHEGHAHGYGSPEHLDMITKNDGYIGRIVEAIEKRGWLEDTMIIVEADHGGTPPDANGRGSHGGTSDAEKYVCFYAAGGGARHAELHDMLVRDTAPAILHALGLEIPDTWNSRVPGGLFADVPENLPRPEGLPLEIREPEPKPETGRFLERFSDLAPALYLSFESIDDLPKGTEQQGKLYLVDGVRGHGMRFDDGSLSIPCPVGNGSFSFTAWVKLNARDGKTPIAAVYNPEEPASKCSVLAAGEKNLALSIKMLDAEKTKNMDMGLPVQREGVWFYLAASLDVETRTAGISLNFEPFIMQELPGKKLLNEGQAARLFLGMDERSAPGMHFPGTLDDVCLYRKVLGDEDIAKLKAYYME